MGSAQRKDCDRRKALAALDRIIARLIQNGAARSIRQAVVFALYADINARMQTQALTLSPNQIATMDSLELFTEDEFDINRPWERFRQKILARCKSRGRSRAVRIEPDAGEAISVARAGHAWRGSTAALFC
jgi:hypothetical protein